MRSPEARSVCVTGLKNVLHRCRFGAVAVLLSLGLGLGSDHAGARSLASPSTPDKPFAPAELAQQQADPPQVSHSLRSPPTSAAELWSRWLELLHETGGISKERFEEVIGLTLPERRVGSNGLVQHILSIHGERFLVAVVSSIPKRSYSSATIQWRRGTFGGGSSDCMTMAQVAKDLAELGWRWNPRRHHAQSWDEFRNEARNGLDLVTYRSTAEDCTVGAQTCLYDPLSSPSCTP